MEHFILLNTLCFVSSISIENCPSSLLNFLSTEATKIEKFNQSHRKAFLPMNVIFEGIKVRMIQISWKCVILKKNLNMLGFLNEFQVSNTLKSLGWLWPFNHGSFLFVYENGNHSKINNNGLYSKHGRHTIFSIKVQLQNRSLWFLLFPTKPLTNLWSFMGIDWPERFSCVCSMVQPSIKQLFIR